MGRFDDLAVQWIAKKHAPVVDTGAVTPMLQSLAPTLLPTGMAVHDANEWLEDFRHWVEAECCFRDRVFWAVGDLHIRFSEWCVRTQGVPCKRVVFEELLATEEVCFADGFSYGLLPSVCLADVGNLQVF